MKPQTRVFKSCLLNNADALGTGRLALIWEGANQHDVSLAFTGEGENGYECKWQAGILFWNVLSVCSHHTVKKAQTKIKRVHFLDRWLGAGVGLRVCCTLLGGNTTWWWNFIHYARDLDLDWCYWSLGRLQVSAWSTSLRLNLCHRRDFPRTRDDRFIWDSGTKTIIPGRTNQTLLCSSLPCSGLLGQATEQIFQYRTLRSRQVTNNDSDVPECALKDAFRGSYTNPF